MIQPGPMTLVQDRGRVGYQQLGVSVSGAIDTDALDIGNRLVGNEFDAGSLEVMLGGMVIEFSHSTVFALTGADVSAVLDGVPIAVNVSYVAHSDSRLELGIATNGLRSYVAICGGLSVSRVLGSYSTHVASGIGGVEGRALSEGDVLEIEGLNDASFSGQIFPDGPVLEGSNELEVRVVLGPQDDEFSAVGIDTLLSYDYTVSDQSNRQGLRLDGPEIESKTGRYDIISDAVVNGSIQVPGDGKPIVLLADRQTIGGYAKIATVVTVDLPSLGQVAPGSKISFTAISTEDAQDLLAVRVECVENAELSRLVSPRSVWVDGDEVAVGVAENGVVRLADVDGITYPISVEKYTPR
ncbi:MAG: biotin-dependent carboxyltransferase family protein [Dehalococcoidia bacterium]|nr:biotin-dependent carboxyltransferase family protein [Dehalococcoidia bacterium]